MAYKGARGFLAIECLIGLFLLASSAAIVASLQWLYVQENIALEQHKNGLLLLSKTLEQCVGQQKIPPYESKQGIYRVQIMTHKMSDCSVPLDSTIKLHSDFILVSVTVSWQTIAGNSLSVHATTGVEII